LFVVVVLMFVAYVFRVLVTDMFMDPTQTSRYTRPSCNADTAVLNTL
jgi:hypothetical protein